MAKKPEPDPRQDALFPTAGLTRNDAVNENKKKPVRSEGMASCPSHYGKRETGLIRIGEHLVWRDHTCTTHANTTIPCRTSLVPICQEGARPRPTSQWRDPKTNQKPVCPHDRPARRTWS